MADNSIDYYENLAREDLTCPKNGASLDISGYAVRLGLIRAKWARFLYNENVIMQEAEQDLETIYKDKFMFFTYDSEYTVDKKDIPMLIKADDEYQKANKIVKKQSEKVKFINEVLSALNSQSFYLNTAMKHILWQSGETV